MATSKIIFSNGKKLAMKSLFDADNTISFSWLALGYIKDTQAFNEESDFEEIIDETYSRIPLRYVPGSESVDSDTGKVTVAFEAELDYQNIITTKSINQLAVVDNGIAHSPETNFYSASIFPEFIKNNTNAMTFHIEFRF